MASSIQPLIKPACRVLSVVGALAWVVTLASLSPMPITLKEGSPLSHVAGATLDISILLWLGFGLGCVVIGGLMVPAFLAAQQRLLVFNHQKEQAQVSAESQTDQVRVLENKVQTLEKALEKALSVAQKSS